MTDWIGISELRDRYYQFGPRLFWAALAGMSMYLGLYLALSMNATWPASCHPGEGRGAIFAQYWCSRTLLGGGWINNCLFLWLWSWPAFFLFVAFRFRRPKPGENPPDNFYP